MASNQDNNEEKYKPSEQNNIVQKHAILGDIQGKLNSECVNGDQDEEKEASSEYSQEDYSSSSKNNKTSNKREKRLMQNRQSASRLRIKKKENFKNLGEETKYLQSVNLELRQQMEKAQEGLFESMKDSIQLRKKIDELQKKQNNLLIEVLKINEVECEPTISSRRTSDCYSSNSSQHANDFLYQQTMPLNQFVLGSQSFDLKTALNLLLSTQSIMNPTYPLLNKGFSLQNSGLLFSNFSEYQDNTLKMTTSLPKSINQLGMLLNSFPNNQMNFGQYVSSSGVQN